MKHTILLESIQGEARLAVIEDGRLCELYIHRPGGDEVAGGIFIGRVENLVTGLNAAFVDIGLEKNGFLSAADLPGADNKARIEKLLRPGKPVLVQISKAQSGQKGHRLTGRVTLPGRLMALLPGQRSAGVSRKIEDEAERARLHGIASEMISETDFGIILRTASAGAAPEALRREFDALTAQWNDLKRRAEHVLPPAVLYDADSLSLRCVRDLMNAETEAVWVQRGEIYEDLRRCAAVLAPDMLARIKLHEGTRLLFELYRVDAQLDNALRKFVWLKSGGSLVIEETEAMTVIDVNTGKFTGSGDVEDTLYSMNREAAEEIVRQLRLRNIGGIIIVDFIDMAEPGRNEALLNHLRALAKNDRGRLKVVGMTGLGLVELTRKKDRRPLSRQLMHVCEACGGEGMVPSHEATARQVIRGVCRHLVRGADIPLMIEAPAPVIGRVKAIGVPYFGEVYGRAVDMPPGQYKIHPACLSGLPEGSRRLNQE